MGFEPTRAEHIGLAVQRLNHSATSSIALQVTFKRSEHTSIRFFFKQKFPTPGVEPGPSG